jgi:hypothetical protein
MRLVRLAMDRLAGACAKRSVTPLPVAPAIRHVGVEAKVVPARRERRPVCHRAEQGAHLCPVCEGKPLGCDRGGELLHDGTS